MEINPDKSALFPTDKLIVVIATDGIIGLLQPTSTPPRPLNLAELDLLAAFSEGHIADEQGLRVYADATGLNREQTNNSIQLTRRLLLRNRLQLGIGTPSANDPVGARRDPATYGIAIPDGPLILRTPCSFRLRQGTFEAVSHDGIRLPAITSVQLHALSRLVEHPLIPDAHRAHQASLGNAALDMEQFLALLAPFVAHRFVVVRVDKGSPTGADLSNTVFSRASSVVKRQMFARNAQAQDEAERARVLAGGPRRPKVIPVAFDVCPPAGLGAVIAYAKVHEGGALDEFYDFRTDWVWEPDRLESFTAEPAIYLFSNYLWSHLECIQVSAQIKKLSPDSITIHGGPDTPKYEGDQHRYFAENPHVDVIIRGEGEISAAHALSKLREVIGRPQPDLSVLAGVAGTTYRTGEGIVRNPDQARVKDLNILPSAYLTGLFDNYIGIDDLFVILETNRGCPYGCTFCDWGSATAGKIREFEMDRVMAELEWTAKAKVASVSIADANFGMFERDVHIARKTAELKNATGFPRGFGGNYAKNTLKYLREIIEVLAAGNILTTGTISLQSMDESTLNVIARSNIKTEKYDAIAVEMRKAKLPLTIELMMGLPGSTLTSFREDLQQCIDRELAARINMTTLLVNSPMNDPRYMSEHKIQTTVPIAPGNLAMLKSTATYDETDLASMHNLRSAYLLFENFGVLRIVSRFVRQEANLHEMLFYERLIADTMETSETSEWPMLDLLTNYVPALMAPPVSWSLVIEELGRYLVREIGLEDSSALRSVLAAQLACLPAHDRVHPERNDLEHDVVAWHLAMIEAKERGNRRGWTDVVPRLHTFGPSSLTVDDPFGLTEASLGINRELNCFGINWELDSPLHRARADLA